MYLAFERTFTYNTSVGEKALDIEWAIRSVA